MDSHFHQTMSLQILLVSGTTNKPFLLVLPTLERLGTSDFEPLEGGLAQSMLHQDMQYLGHRREPCCKSMKDNLDLLECHTEHHHSALLATLVLQTRLDSEE